MGQQESLLSWCVSWYYPGPKIKATQEVTNQHLPPDSNKEDDNIRNNRLREAFLMVYLHSAEQRKEIELTAYSETEHDVPQ